MFLLLYGSVEVLRLCYLNAEVVPGARAACHQTRGGVGIFVHIPGHT